MPFSRTSAYPDCRRIPKSIVAGGAPVNEDVRPATSSGPGSLTVNCMKPSPPAAIVCSDNAQASKHPSQPSVFCTDDPFTVTLTGRVHSAPPVPPPPPPPPPDEAPAP